jgi:hypothetical protein
MIEPSNLKAPVKFTSPRTSKVYDGVVSFTPKRLFVASQNNALSDVILVPEPYATYPAVIATEPNDTAVPLLLNVPL